MSSSHDLYQHEWPTVIPSPIHQQTGQSNHTNHTDHAETLADVEALIKQAIKKLSVDAGAVLEQDILEAFKQLYQQNPASFNRYRQQIKESKQVMMALFDKLTLPSSFNGAKGVQSYSAQLAETAQLLFPAIAVYEQPVEGESLFDEIKSLITQYVIADEETLIAATLWVAFSWFIEVVNYAPIANITAPEKRCGKTKLLSVLKRLSYQSFTTSNISAAALFRLVELYKPTLLIDEVDSFLNLHEDMRGIINAGFTRESAYIVRCVGEEQIPTPFNVWGAKALCGIGKIADTLQDRSIPLKLRRKSQGETVNNVDKSDPQQWALLRAKLARFAQDNQVQLINIQPEPLPQLNDRANDCWEPLRQIAELAGGRWPQLATIAALLISSDNEQHDSTRTELLNDIKTLFDTKKIDRIFSHDLVNALNEDNEANWCGWNKGRGMTARNLAKILKDFDIVSNTLRIGVNDRAKGYTKDQFQDAFKRYLTSPPLATPVTNVTTGQVKGDSNTGQNTIRDISLMSRTQKPLQQQTTKDCHVVTDNYFTQAHQHKQENEMTLQIRPKETDNKTQRINDQPIQQDTDNKNYQTPDLSSLTPEQQRWLEHLAEHLTTTPAYLLQKKIIVIEDIVEFYNKDPAVIAQCLQSSMV